MGARFCSNCGSPVDPNATFCPRCGTRLTPGIPPPAQAPVAPTQPAPPAAPPSYAPPSYTMPPPYTPPPQYAPPRAPAPAGYPAYPPPAYPTYPQYDYATMEKQKRVGRTKTGVLLITIGFLINWLPFVGFVGALLVLIGAIFVILGRKAFGDRHSLFVVLSVVLIIVGLIGGFVFGVIVVFQAVFAAQTGDAGSVVSAFRNLAIGLVALGAVSGIASVLFVHELENQTGKYMLYAGYALNIVAGIVVLIFTLNALGAIGPGVTLQDVLTFQSQLTAIQLLQGVPSLVFAGAYFIAYSRISRGEIPRPPGAPPPAPAWPTTPATGGYVPPLAVPPAPSTPAAPPSAPPPSPPPGPP